MQLELSSPERRIIKKQVTMVTVPGSEGLYTVLAGHAPMITTMGFGVVEVYENDDKTITDRIFVTKGFAEVTVDNCALLADEAIITNEINRVEVEKEIQSLEKDLAVNDAIEEREPLEYKLAIANAKLHAIT